MDLNRLNPWNWFKHEQPQSPIQLPFRRHDYRHTPFDDPLGHLHREFDRLLERFFEDWDTPVSELFPHPASELNAGFESLFRPRLDIEVGESSYRVSIAVPGFDAEQIAAELNGDLLLISGRHAQKRADQQAPFDRMERPGGSFTRTLRLPEDADGDRIDARVEHGLMRLVIPRTPSTAAAVRQIPITH